MARTNYQYEKRQRDLAKKKKKEEKRLKKLNKAAEGDVQNPETAAGEIVEESMETAAEVVETETGSVESGVKGDVKNDVEKEEGV